MASKKSFKSDNPAMMYITSKTQDTQYTHNTENAQDAHSVYKTHNTDKQHTVRNTQNTHNEYTYKTDNMYTDSENKSKRLNLLIRPSLHSKAQKIAHIQRSSVNDIVNLALARYVEEHAQDLEKYHQVYEDSK